MEPYLTLDGSLIWEFIRPESHGSRKLSLALAEVESGTATRPHRHVNSEEVYYVLSGEGELTVADELEHLRPGEAALIRAGDVHSIRCLSAEPLRILCCCAPPYRHEDTELLEGPAA